MWGTNQQVRPKRRRSGARQCAGAEPARRHTLLEVEPLEARVVPTIVTIGTSKDNTLYESLTGHLSNGAGPGFYVGVPGGGGIRRGVIAFDIAGNVPAGATINSVTLRLNVSMSISGPQSVELRRLLADWGEGTSVAVGGGGGGGVGGPAITNDATWVHRFFNTATWANPGGDFTSTASASASVAFPATYTWGSTPQMVADVQAWLNNPGSNFGWALLGGEAGSSTAKRFDTKEHPIAANRPLLTIDFTSTSPTTLRVTSFEPTRTGFTAEFSQAFDPSVLNLYDGFGGTRGEADVTVVGRTTGPVRGSLVIDPSNSRFTFIRTGGLMPSGTGSEIYDVTLRSAANAFRTPGAMGTLLDGNGDGTPGDNYTNTFTVASSTAVVVSIPDFSRGPEQPVHVSTAIAGLPIFVSNPAGITSLTLNLRYNPTLLRINGASTPIAGASASVNTTTTPGVAAITFTSPTPLTGSGLTELVRLDAVVPGAVAPATSPYNVKHVLNLDNIILMTSGGSVPTLDDDGLHAVLYVGDTNASGGYTASDANRALQFAVGLGTGYATNPNTDPDLVSDVNSSGTSTAGDATNILRKAVGLPILPPALIPDPPASPSIMPGPVDPFLNIPKTFRARPGGVLTVPVNVDYSEGLQSMDLAISYDAKRLEVVSVQRGRLTRDFDVMAANLDQGAGTIQLGMLRSAGAVSGRGKGSVLRITFRVKADAPTGGAIINIRRDLGPTMTQLNDGELDLIPDPSNEAGDVLDGVITVRGPVRGRLEANPSAAVAGQAALADVVFAGLSRRRKG